MRSRKRRRPARASGISSRRRRVSKIRTAKSLGSMSFRVLRFKPAESGAAAASRPPKGVASPPFAQKPTRIKPPMGLDNGWWWEKRRFRRQHHSDSALHENVRSYDIRLDRCVMRVVTRASIRSPRAVKATLHHLHRSFTTRNSPATSIRLSAIIVDLEEGRANGFDSSSSASAGGRENRDGTSRP